MTVINIFLYVFSLIFACSQSMKNVVNLTVYIANAVVDDDEIAFCRPFFLLHLAVNPLFGFCL